MTLDHQAGEDPRLRNLAATASLGVAILLIALKLAAFLLTESAGVLSSLMDSMLDGLAATVTLLGVRAAQRPPSYSYRFGRGKAEPLAALAQAAFILGSAVLLSVEVVNRLVTTPTVRYEGWGIGALVVSSIIVLGLIAFQKRVVEHTGSIAIRADLRHYFGDIVVNLAVIVALVLTMLTGWILFDSLCALVVAAFLVANSWGVGRQALRLLMDRELGQAERDAIRAAVLAHPQARGVHDLRTRDSGTMRFVELHLELDGSLTLMQAHDITDEIETSLRRDFAQTEILIHQEPAGLDDQRLDQRIAEASQQ
jgi:ferrous-iron efflux pump FieF